MGALPDWCEPLPDAEQMQAIDRWAIEDRRVPSLELMERAGAAVAGEVERLAPDGPLAVVCGKGNNGGDGLVAARLLRERRRDVVVVCVCDPAALSGDALVNLQRLPGEPPLVLGGDACTQAAEPSEREHDGLDADAGGRRRPRSVEAATAAVVTQALATAEAIVDALLGTGFRGEPHGVVAQAIEAIDASAAPVVSVDVPSGVDASTGEVAAAAVRARTTVALHAAKPGLWVAPGKRHAGETLVADIGIPRGAPSRANAGLISDLVLAALPTRTASSTKFTSGHVVVAGGSPGLMGAPAMAALAAMRAGAGYVTACVPRSQAHVLDAQLMEVMTRPLGTALDEQSSQDIPGAGDARGSLSAQDVPEALDALERAGALVLGPGLGREPGAFSFARDLAAAARAPTLIDADGLNAHAGRLAALAGRLAATVLTPHAGELARLLELDVEQVERRRLHHARTAAKRASAVVVLKGDDTLVAAPDGRVAVSPGGAPALASAGSGDVLSGVIAALLAQGLDAFDAAAAGVHMHVRAGREAARRLGAAEGVIASDVIAALPAIRGFRP